MAKALAVEIPKLELSTQQASSSAPQPVPPSAWPAHGPCATTTSTPAGMAAYGGAHASLAGQ